MRGKSRLALGFVFLVGITGAGLVTGAAQASAPAVNSNTVIYNNLGPGNSYGTFGWCVSGVSTGCGREDIAMPFTPSTAAQVTQIDLALTNFTGPNNATVQLAQDAGGLPGAIVRSWSVANQPPHAGCCALTTISVSPLLPVGAGHKYWLIAVAGPNTGNNTSDDWQWTYNGLSGAFAVNAGLGWIHTGGTLGAFDVRGCTRLCKST